MRVEEADRGLDDAGGVVVRRDLERIATCVIDNGNKQEAHVARHHVLHEAVRKLLGFAWVYDGVVPHRRQVAHDGLVGGDLRGRVEGLQLAADEVDFDRGDLVVRDGDDGLGGALVDELEPEYILVIGESRRESGAEYGCAFGLEVGIEVR